MGQYSPRPPGTYNKKMAKARQPIWAFSCASKRPDLSALVHISISQNGPILTKMYPLLLVFTTRKWPKLENAPADLGDLLRVEKALSKCISTYKHLPKRANTHQDVTLPSCSNCKLQQRNGTSQLWSSVTYQKRCN